MLEFLVALAYLLIFVSPLAKSGIIYIKEAFKDEEHVSVKWIPRIIWAIAGLLFLGFVDKILYYWTDLMWFRELDQVGRFWTGFKASYLSFFTGAILVFAVLTIVAYLARVRKEELKEGSKLNPLWIWLSVIALNAVVALLIGWVASVHWNDFLLYFNQVPFGIRDPIFSRDVGFYIFTVPLLTAVCDVLIILIILAMIEAGALTVLQYYDRRSYVDRHDCYARKLIKISDDSILRNIVFRGINIVAVLGISLMVLFIYRTRLSMWSILYSARGAVFGAGWTDVNVQITVYWIFIAALVIATLCLIIAAITKSLRATIWMAGIGFGTCIATWLIGIIIIPTMIQWFGVEPNELTKERQYIKHNIAFTRQAYGLTDESIKQLPFPTKEVTPDIVKKDEITLSNIRLWDWRVLQNTNNQRQIFRSYYSFPDVDVDRYKINGKITEVMLSARELDQEKLAESAKTWQNQKLVYTHGFGLVASPVNVVTDEGLPDYWLGDIPPKTEHPALKIKQSRIYFGEKTDTDVYVKTKHQEFDYPEGDVNKTFTYDGPGGIEVGSGLRRFALAWRFGGLRLLTAGEITPKSRFMFRRDIESRVQELAPFLTYDKDPYQVIADGQIWFMWDAYTTTQNYPYSEPTEYYEGDGWIQEGVNYNYIRNSVKVVVNAYTGKVDFYVFNPEDPIIRTYQKIFPKLFKPASKMPRSLRKHVRYPEDLLTAQSNIYAFYHMDDPNVFYNKEDAWQISNEKSHDKVQQIIPYYVIMRIPGEEEEEFVQILPFTPLSTKKNTRNNMVAWIAGRADGRNYGKLVLYKFPKGQLVYGPMQISSRINQDEKISADFTLWNQQGSKVITGNLLVIPLSNHELLYVQPVYLQAEDSPMPELKKVIIASGKKLSYADSFEDALKQLVGGTGEEEVVSKPETGKEKKFETSDLIAEVASHLEKYQQLSGQGKYAEAGKEMEEAVRLLNILLKKDKK